MTILGFGVNDSNLTRTKDASRYKGKKGQTDMISLVWLFKDDKGNYQFGEEATPKFTQAEIHYIPTKGYILDNDYLSAKLGSPKRKIATFIVKYKTDRQGTPEKPFEYEVMEWNFSDDKFMMLKSINSEYNLTCHDLKITCEEEKYQKMTIMPTKHTALWQKNEGVRKAILEEVEQLEKRLSLGRELSEQELKEHYGEVSVTAPAHSVDVNFDNLLGSIG